MSLKELEKRITQLEARSESNNKIIQFPECRGLLKEYSEAGLTEEQAAEKAHEL